MILYAVVCLILNTNSVFTMKLNKVGRTSSIAVFTSKIERDGGGCLFAFIHNQLEHK